MYGKVKLTKRQIKEDKFTAFMLNSKQQVEENWQYLAIAVIVVILGVVGSVYYFDSVEEASRQAAANLSKGNLEFRGGSSPEAILTFMGIINNFGGTKSAEQATFMLGKVNLQTRNYPESIRYFEMYLQKYQKNLLNRASSYTGLGTALENQGNFQEAAEAFEKGTMAMPDSPLQQSLRIGAMRNYLKVDSVEKARPHFEYITERFEGSETANRAARLFYEKARASYKDTDR
ncbi:MAG: tetratricopeptide repeat protein [candidate division Zixibacteria bacterium]|nr:tetratricopeptide repeat protein [candidate division Zixibacteria bacterium]